MKLGPLHALLALLALACVLVSPVAAQQPPSVTLEVQAGYNGAGDYRTGHWFPVSITATNDGADLRGTIEWRFPGDDTPAYSYELDLPRGARKQVTLAVTTSASSRSALVALVAGGTTIAETRVRLNPIAWEQVAVGVASTDPSLLNSLEAARIANNTTTRVTHLDPALLPADAALLAGLDVIFIHDLPTADLNDGQRQALDLWTRLGGQLVVGGGPPAAQTTPGLSAILPVEVGELQRDVSTDSLGILARRNDIAGTLPTTTVSAVTPRPGAEALDRDGLLVAGDLGAGRVIFAAFDLAATRAWGGEADLWGQVLGAEPKVQIGQSFRSRSENLLRDALDLPALQLPSTGLLLLLMALYIVIVGPVNFLTLRRLRRLELAWVTTPLLVVGFLAAAYGASFVLRGTRPQITQLTIVQGFEGQTQGQATAFLGVFSPQRRSYRLDLAPETLVTPGTFEGFQFRSVSVTGDGATTGVRDLLIDVSSLRTMMVEQTAIVPAVSSALQIGAREVTGNLRLESDLALRDAVVVWGSSAQSLGDLEPGDDTAVRLRGDLLNFPDQISLSSGGLIRREQVLNTLFGYDRFTLGGPTFQGDKGIPEEGVYLLGWAETPALSTQINGDTGRQQGETLFIIRLNS